MLENMAKGMGFRSMVEGFVNGPTTSPVLNGNSTNGVSGTNGTGGDPVSSLLTQIGGLLQPALAKVTGSPTVATPDITAQVAKKLADDPAILAALRNALADAQTPALPEAAERETAMV